MQLMSVVYLTHYAMKYVAHTDLYKIPLQSSLLCTWIKYQYFYEYVLKKVLYKWSYMYSNMYT